MPQTRCPPMPSSLAASLLVEGNGPITSSPGQPASGFLPGGSSPKNTPVTKEESPQGMTAALKAGIGIAVLLILIVVVCVGLIYCRRRKRRGSFTPHGLVSSSIALNLSNRRFTFEELQTATDGFSDLNLLGQGGFGLVHKGVLPDGKEVAIKQLKVGSTQGEAEFKAEVETIGGTHHRNLINLVGYCASGTHRMLVYDFAANGTLESHLHGEDRPTLTWPMRVKIALGTVRGLVYLHEECIPMIIHRDIKASNILLDENYEAKVADFGLAKLVPDLHTHVSTRVKGTFGYFDPDYFQSGRLTHRSDVYSFGVILLELISGRRPIDRSRPSAEEAIVCWAKPLIRQALENSEFHAIADPRLPNYDSEEMSRALECASACIRPYALKRPTMTEAFRLLEGSLSMTDFDRGSRGEFSEDDSAYQDALGLDLGDPENEDDDQPFRFQQF